MKIYDSEFFENLAWDTLTEEERIYYEEMSMYYQEYLENEDHQGRL